MSYNEKALSLDEIHEATFNLLVETKLLCEKIGTKYYLAYGTLLGAVRHKGFIPWDDDVDIWMTRDDYDTFFSYLEEHKETLYPISYCNRRNTANYLFAINRITDKRYKYIDTKTHVDVDYGVFIDVYPLDYVGDTRDEYLKKYKKIEKLNSMYSVYLQNKSYSGNLMRSIIKHVFHYFLQLRFKNTDDILCYVERETKRIIGNEKNSQLVGIVIWFAYVQCYKKELFKEETKIEFHGELFSVPRKYDEILREIYGDYMKLPPEEKRKAYHDYNIYKRNE